MEEGNEMNLVPMKRRTKEFNSGSKNKSGESYMIDMMQHLNDSKRDHQILILPLF